MGGSQSGAVHSATDTLQRQWRTLRHGRKSVRIMMTGLDYAGKSTLLHRYIQASGAGDVVTTIPTIGLSVESLESIPNTLNQLSITSWDEPLPKFTSLYKSVYHGFDFIIFVVDSTDFERLDNPQVPSDIQNTAKEVLQNLLADYDLRDAHLLILANKQDKHSAICAQEVQDRLFTHRRAVSWHAAGRLGFLMGTHPTAGQASPVRHLSGNFRVLEHLWQFVPKLERVVETVNLPRDRIVLPPLEISGERGHKGGEVLCKVIDLIDREF